MAGGAHCVDPESGQCHWVHETNAVTWGSPYAADGKVCVPTQKYLNVTTVGQKPRILDKSNLSSAVFATPVVANVTLYITSTRYIRAVEKAK